MRRIFQNTDTLSWINYSGTAHRGPSLNLLRQKSLPLSSQTQCHNSALRLPVRRVCLEAFICVNKCSPWWGSTIISQVCLTDKKRCLFFFCFFSFQKVSAVWLQCIISVTALTFSLLLFSNDWSQSGLCNQTRRPVDAQWVVSNTKVVGKSNDKKQTVLLN